MAEVELALDQMGFGEDIDWEHHVPDDFEELWAARGMADRVIAAAKLVKERYTAAAAIDLGPGGVARFGDDFIRYSQAADYILTEGGVEWLSTLSVDEVLAILPKASKFRKTAMVAIAEDKGLGSGEGSFWVNRGGGKKPSLSVMPVSNKYAPKYAETMTSGEIRRKT